MNSIELRNRFFSFFQKHSHTIVPSSSVIPAQDPTLLFTNAGMNQFKDLFLGLEKRSYDKAVTIQKCLRAGGKHNDLDNVGFTKRHLTFFEMMGNFSFNSYFKKEAIAYGWNFLTQEIGLPHEKLHATVFETDNEAFEIWHDQIGLPKERIHKLGAETNFWQMGDTGPCGPCSEIFIDRGIEYGSLQDSPASNSDRFLEIWNLVFIQYDRLTDGSLKKLTNTGVDTGMGLERLALVVQGVDSVFQTDLFMPIIHRIQVVTHIVYAEQNYEYQAAFHVLADHIRSAVFLIAEGAVPSNEGRGYVLRKIIRRAELFAQKINKKSCFAELVSVVVDQFFNVYPDLFDQKDRIYQTLLQETQKFSLNLARGNDLLKSLFITKKNNNEDTISGSEAFKLYDTFGFPIELITAESRYNNFTVDMMAFDREMEKQKGRSGKKEHDLLDSFEFKTSITTEFIGYKTLTTESKIAALIMDNCQVESVKKGQELYLIPEKSPFFIVGGGQVPDQGTVCIKNCIVPVNQARYIGGTAIGLKIVAPTDFHVGDSVFQEVDYLWRRDVMKNHTATHLLQAALIELFGTQIKQAGSLVHPEYLRFDFTFAGALSWKHISDIESVINKKIMDCIPVVVHSMSLEEAKKNGALAFFGDKYCPDNVRMVVVDQFSKELCGGTHVSNTGEIGIFKITELLSPAAGLKRIVAVTGFKALTMIQSQSVLVKDLASFFKTKPEHLFDAAQKLRLENKKLTTDIVEITQQYSISMINHQWILENKSIGTFNFCPVLIPSLFVELCNLIAQKLAFKNKGLSLIVVQLGESSRFACAFDPSVDWLKNACAEFLKESTSVHFTVKESIIYGGGKIFFADLKETVGSFLSCHQKEFTKLKD